MRVDGNWLQVPLQDRIRGPHVRAEAETLRSEPVRESRSLHGKGRRVPMPLPRLVGRRKMRKTHVPHPVQAAQRAHVARAVLAGPDDRLHRDGHHRHRVVRQAAFPGEDRETARRGRGPESQHK